MKKIIISILLVVLFQRVISQTPFLGCNQSTTNINTIFYPNTTSNITSTVTNISGMYLCGPNTLVYDTSNVAQGPFVCRTVFVSASSTLITNSWACAYYEIYFVKNNATIIFTPNTSNTSVHVYYEPNAIIIDNSAGVNTYSCTSIFFPAVNCSATSIKQNNLSYNLVIYPNPANDILNFEIPKPELFSKIKIVNSLGQLVKEEEATNINKVNIKDLPVGIYFLKIRYTNSIHINKRFIIAR